jgi:hypothetical protein
MAAMRSIEERNGNWPSSIGSVSARQQREEYECGQVGPWAHFVGGFASIQLGMTVTPSVMKNPSLLAFMAAGECYKKKTRCCARRPLF